ncbi:site-specific integrase [Ktedonobacter sp. SOSP1-52]|uniref:tyrosine-type recombinase/integrase n=1 Tax=Ktedonobacter sp. SOSP1-52 TaxID=2778366 RepID=UPI001915084F|nr:site-specific integrase [Ktedonobacter sp. SOSP1-52]
MPRSKREDDGKLKRRARGEGTVVQHSDGRWIARVPLGNGKRKEEYYKTKQEAERAKRRMLNERDAGKLATEREQTLKDYLEYWLKAHRTTIRKTTYEMYQRNLAARVIPVLGHVGLRKLKVEMFQSLYQEWEEEQLSPNTIRLIHRIINEALNDAVKWKKLAYNPVQNVKLPKTRKVKIYVLTDEEIEHLLNCAQRNRLYALFRMALLLGMRKGELLGLKWSDINFDTATLTIKRTVSYVRDPATGHSVFHVGLPKTEAGERSIHLPLDIVNVLREHQEKQNQIRASVSLWKNLDLVFCTRGGNYITPQSLTRCFDRLLGIAGLEHMKFHALRHNASRILRKLKIDPVVRMEMLGHTSLEMTDITYGHATQEQHKEAAEDIDRLFGENL